MHCSEHHEEATGKCIWCSTPICQRCIAWAMDNKLCPNCYAKLSRQGAVSNKPKIKEIKEVRNVDPALSDDRIKEGKAMISGKAPQEKKRIKNIPDWPELK